jgi:hypothetical protein
MTLETAIFVYFSAEKTAALIKFSLALAAFLGAMYFYRRQDAARGFFYVASFILLSQILVGGTIFFRTDAQVAQLLLNMQSDLPAMVSREIARMTRVVMSFSTYRTMQLIFILIGLVMVAMGQRLQWRRSWGAGLGFMSLGAMLFGMDLLAAHRAAVYLQALSDATP